MSTRASLVPLALLAFSAPALARQTCSGTAAVDRLDAGTVQPELWTPDGAPVLGGPFSLALRGGAPSAIGLIGYTANESPTFLPAFQATLHPSAATLIVEPVVTDSSGATAHAFDLPALDPSLCGTVVVAQGGLLDAGAPGGIALSNALRLFAGEPSANPLTWFTFESNDLVLGFALGDLDLDGIGDLVVETRTVFSCPFSCTYSHSLKSYLGVGDGTFTFGGSVAIGPPVTEHSSDVRIEELTGDGIPDLVYVSTDQKGSIAPGLGNGTFSVPVAAAERWYLEEAPVDFDGDGDLDVVSWSSGPVLHRNDGTGSFSVAASFPLSGSFPEIEFGELDGLPGLDFAVRTSSNSSTRSVTLFTNDGMGGWTVGPTQVYGSSDYTLEVFDADGDGLDDLLTGTSTRGTFQLLLNLGGLSFAPPLSTPAFLAGTSASVEAMDVDLDGVVDLVGYVDLVLQVAQGAGDGTFQLLEQEAFFPSGTLDRPQLAELGGVRCLATLVAGDVTFLPLDERGGPFGPRETSVGFDPENIASGDLDGDGIDDAVVACLGSQEVQTLFGSAGGAFSVQQVLTDVDAPFEVTLGDVDADGVLDLFVAYRFRDDVELRLGSGTGTFPTVTSNLDVLSSTSARERRLATADLDLDGILDLVASGPTTGATRLGLGGGAFALPVAQSALSGAFTFDLGDVDGDGFLDVATAGASNGVALGLGNGNFGATSALPSSREDVALGDFTGDGTLDLVTCTTGAVQLLPGLGTGGLFGPEVVTSAGARHLTAADFDGDGVTDLVSSSLATNDWYTGADLAAQRVTHSFVLGRTYFTLPELHRSAAGDFDGDGTLDLLQCNQNRNSVWLLRNRSVRGF